MTSEIPKINLVIMPTPVDKGMAGTSRLRNFIKFLPKDSFKITNLIFSSKEETYEFLGATIRHMDMENEGIFARWKLLKEVLKELFEPDAKNILFFYDIPHTPFRALAVYWAKNKWGYTNIIDVVEDYNTYPLNLGIRGNFRVFFCGLVQKHLSWFADGTIAISNYLVSFLERNFRNRPIVHLPVAFDPDSLIESFEQKASDTLTVFYGGSFGEKDGMEYLIAGFEKASEQISNIQLHLTGKGSRFDMEKLKKLIDISPAADKIINHGFLPYDEYCRILGGADILCMTRRDSKFANAGFPYKLGEFLATGKPVIVSRLGEIATYLSDDDCCFVTPESSEEIGDAILSLKEDSERTKIGSRGKHIAFENFNATIIADKLTEFIIKLGAE